jgi:hypothetical protein
MAISPFFKFQISMDIQKKRKSVAYKLMDKQILWYGDIHFCEKEMIRKKLSTS